MHSLLDIIRKTTDFFASKEVDNPRFNAEVIIGHALGLKRMNLYVQFERLLTEAELERIRPLVKRRSQREPLSYVLGETEFFDLRIKCDRRALIPRPETEELVEHVLSQVPDKSAPLRLLDLGTGTGCIALALASKLPACEVQGVDACTDALSLAKENAQNLGLQERVHFFRSDWFSALPPDVRFDVIVSNPPYLTEAETEETQLEVKAHEPHKALAAPDQGMADLKRIISGAPLFLKAGGLLALETGIEQHPVLLQSLLNAGYEAPQSLKDLSGRLRFLSARRPA